MKKLYQSILLLALAFSLQAQFQIQNPIATPGLGRVTITYDLAHPDDRVCTISIEVSADGGANYNIFPLAVTGDVGDGILPGEGKSITWFPAADLMSEGDNYKIRIKADDHYFPPMAFVEGGSFHNGTSTISLSSFYIATYEVTQESYQTVMSTNPSWYFGNPVRPVERFTWFKAIEYCNRRSILEGLNPCYRYDSYGYNPQDWPLGWNTTASNHLLITCNWNRNGYRLPTEMEWMYAARGATLSHSYSYSGSNDIDAVAWYASNSDLGDGQGSRTHDVGTKDHNELYLFDMSGNVWEWCWDINGSYPSEDQNNPHGAITGNNRILRGGAYNQTNTACTVAYRGYVSPISTDRSIGMRVAQSIPVIETVANPEFNPPAGSYLMAQEVSISCATPGASIHYTTDGSEPDESSALYSTPIFIDADATLKAKAFMEDWHASATASANYQITILPADFAYVASGTFHNGYSNVTLSSFYIDKYEVSQAAYEAVMGSNPADFTGNPLLPVDSVTWFNAIEYCNRRSLGEGLSPCYTFSTYGVNPALWPVGWDLDNDNHYLVSCDWAANGYRLPTEMEWLFAFIGGNSSLDYLYSGSNDVNLVAWYVANSGATSHQIGSLASNELGIHDMSGNLGEKMWDIYTSSLPVTDQVDPKGALSGNHCASRGGNWDSAASSCEKTLRGSGGFVAANPRSGFRVARSSM